MTVEIACLVYLYGVLMVRRIDTGLARLHSKHHPSRWPLWRSFAWPWYLYLMFWASGGR